MAKKLFEVAVIFNERRTKKHDDEGTEPESKLIVAPMPMLAKDEREVLIRSAQNIPSTYSDKLDQVEIAVRPF